MRSGNPALNDNSFGGRYMSRTAEGTMTLGGTAIKTAILLAILLSTFMYTWNMTTVGYEAAWKTAEAEPARFNDEGKQLPTQISIPSSVYPYAMVGCFGGFVVAMIIIFNPTTAPFLSPIYAGLEGLALGAISAGFEAKYPGIAIQAGGATFGVLAGLLLIYMTGLVRPSQNFALGLLAAMFGILVVYFLDILLQAFGAGYVPVVHGNSWASIGFSAFVVIIAALNLVLDFDFIEKGVENKAPKYMEWYGAFGLMVTLVWLYLEIIRLIAKARSKD